MHIELTVRYVKRIQCVCMYILVKPFDFITETNHLRMSVFALPPNTLPTFLLPSRDIAKRSLKRLPTLVSHTFYTRNISKF